jgi:hypothetical protein
MGIEARGAPTDLPNFGQVGIVGMEGGEFLEWVGRELRRQRLKRERLVAGGDVEVEIAPGTPP